MNSPAQNVPFVPHKVQMEGHAVPLITNINLKHFPFQSFLELTEIIGHNISSKVIDQMGVIKVTGYVTANMSQVAMPDAPMALMLLSRHTRCSPIYLGADEESAREVGELIESLLASVEVVTVESEISYLHPDAEVVGKVDPQDIVSTARRTFTVRARDLTVYFFSLETLKKEVRELITQGSAPTQAPEGVKEPVAHYPV